uniref:Uncharacterized protein n=1 Tax=Electrophorus electricus TaxID=8005 RepID=A0AAY5F430_ELEEL
MERRALLYSSCLCLVLASVAAVRYNENIDVLKNIKDLKNKTTFGQEFPQHGLLLLFWFANNVEIDQNEVIWPLNFNPAQRGYGFHRYCNGVSDQVTQRTALPDVSNMNSVYYALGNLNDPSQLPSYVTQDYYNKGGPTGNIDRVVIRFSNNERTIEEVYITQHYVDRNRGSGYDPDNTYRIRPSLLREIQGINRDDTCVDDTDQSGNAPCEILDEEQRISDLQRAYPDIPGLVRFMIRAGYNPNRVKIYSETLSCRAGNTQKRRPRSLGTLPKCQEHNNIKLEVKSTSKGYARITWSGIPENLLKMQMNIGLYEEKASTELKLYPLNGRPYGTIDTSTSINPGLHIKLLRILKNDSPYYSDIWSGPVFDEANGVLPTRIKGYDASLQLYTKGGYACARLYISKSFTDWKNVFMNSWVGFYKTTLDENKEYEEYQWSTNFKKRSNQDYTPDYDIYEYKSHQYVGPGVQARFMLEKSYRSEKARTEPWDGVGNPQSSTNDDGW